ncbi:hypothetical protein OG879_28305 [Streptomyces caniferus]|uniref:hypothetical protein n=1 Tax=Streptomyces caniferus TaxID=285557 RepID=UPI002E2BB5B7|nr:hypothetical protein [Streptomyces caniferus]
MATGPDLDVTFYDHLAPGIQAGTYTIHAEHKLLKGAEDITTSAPLPTAEARFEVRAAQFVLDEASVQAVYPPPGSSGDYRTVLPHITLTRSVLPWERDLHWARDGAVTPWMALLVFEEGELSDDPEAVGLATSRPVTKLCVPDEPTVQPPGIRLGDLDPRTAESTCRTIDVPVALFRALMPRKDELPYLTHVRDVHPPTPDRAGGEKLTEGSFAVVTGSRFARDRVGPRSVHLVSLEGHDEALDGSFDSGATHLRLAALWSWSFTNDHTAELDPECLLKQLVARSLGDPGNAERLALRLEPAPQSEARDAHERYVRDRLARGYVPVSQRLLSGELSYAWYRGPCTAVTAQPLPEGYDPDPETRTTADHALIYDKEYGVFDVSYASAWTLGRTLALADPDYSADLVRARRQLSNQAVGLMAIAADPSRARLATPAPGRTAADPETQLRPNLDWLRTLAHRSGDIRRALATPQHDLLQEEPPPPPPPARRNRADRRLLLGMTAQRTALTRTAEQHTAGLPAWMERLDRLHGIPFGYLVPDPRMLPPESLRLFRIDPHWLEALRNGARSIGLHTSLDRQLDDTLQAAVAARTMSTPPEAGLLLRSALVPAWPEFDLIAKRDSETLAELRRDHPAPDVLLLLFDNVPDEIVIREPGEGIHFGTTSGGKLALRHLVAGEDAELGAPQHVDWPTDSGTVFSRHLRPGTHHVLNLLDGDPGLVPALSRQFGRDGNNTRLSPSEFALEMINAPLEQKLVPAAGGRNA